MRAATAVAIESSNSHRIENFDLGFLPSHLSRQCRSLIESYHEVHGYACLPDILWKSRLGPFIEKHRELRQCLRKASTTRSAKKAHDGFVRIATTILSLEILASSFAGWGAIYPEAGETACAILKRNGRGAHMPLMEFYLILQNISARPRSRALHRRPTVNRPKRSCIAHPIPSFPGRSWR